MLTPASFEDASISRSRIIQYLIANAIVVNRLDIVVTIETGVVGDMTCAGKMYDIYFWN